jgi:hypothetical protein
MIGSYFVPYNAIAEPSVQANDEKLAIKTWDWTEKVLKEKFDGSWSWNNFFK